MIKVIAVDFGGVYFTWSKEKFIRDLSEKLRVDYQTVERAHAEKIQDLHVQKITEKMFWDNFCKVIGKEVDHSFLNKITYSQFHPRKSVINLMKKLRKKYRIVLLSNHTTWLDELDKKYRIYSNFDIVISSHRVKVQK